MPATPDRPPSILPGSESDILDEAVRLGLLTGDEAAECRRIRQAMKGMGIAPKFLDEIAREKGFLQGADVERLRAGGAPPTAGAKKVTVPGYKIHGLLEQTEGEATYQALRVETGERCALRVLKEGAGPAAVRAFSEEGRRLTRCSHPNLLSGIEARLDASPSFIAVQSSAGELLRTALERKGPIPEEKALEITREVAGALDAIHRAGLVHGEVDPGRILLPRAGGPLLMPIRPVSGPAPAAETISPERVLADETPAASSDLYSLGATLFMMLTGNPPFAGGTPEEVMARQLVAPAPSVRDASPGVGEVTGRIVQRLLEKEPSRRYPSAAALRVDLEGLLGSGEPPGVATRESPPAPLPRRPARIGSPLPKGVSSGGHRWLAAALSVALLLVSVMVLVIVTGDGDPPGLQERRPFRVDRRAGRPDRGAPEIRRPEPDPPARATERYPGVPPLLPEDGSEETAELSEGTGPEREAGGEMAVPKVERIPPVPPSVADRRAFLQAFLATVAGYKFEAAGEICQREIDEGSLLTLAQAAKRGLRRVEGVMERARAGIPGWEGQRREIRLRDGLAIEGRVRSDPNGLLALHTDDGEVAVPVRLLSADDLLALAGVDDPLERGLTLLLLYRDAPGAETCFRELPAEAMAPYLEVIGPLAQQSLLEVAEVAYGRKAWCKALEAYLDLLGRFPAGEVHFVARERILERVRNALLLSRIAGSFHTEVEVVGGTLAFRYRLREPREWEDWTGGEGHLPEEETTAVITWTGATVGDLVVEWDLEGEGGECWLEILSGDRGERGYRVLSAGGRWRLTKISGGGEADLLAESGAAAGRQMGVRLERIQDGIALYRAGESSPFLSARDDEFLDGTIRLGGDLSRLEGIRISGRLSWERRR